MSPNLPGGAPINYRVSWWVKFATVVQTIGVVSICGFLVWFGKFTQRLETLEQGQDKIVLTQGSVEQSLNQLAIEVAKVVTRVESMDRNARRENQ